MLDLSGTGSRFLVALLLMSCSSNDPSKSEGEADGSDSGTTSSTSGMGAGNVSSTSGAASTSSPSTTNTSGSPTTSASTGGDSGGSGGTGGSSDSGGSQSTTRGQGFGFGDVGAGGSGGSGDSGGDGGATSGTPATTATTGGDCTPAVDCEPEPLPSTGDAHQDCVDRVNQFRVGCWCMPALERWTEGEDCANQHAEYDSDPQRGPHAGFNEGICENGGNAQNECPGWGSETQVIEGCLQMMYDEGPPPSEQCSGQCYTEHGHFINMTNDNYTRVACGFYTTPGGDVWAVQNFR